MVTMADSTSTTPLDIEALNQLATRLRDDYVDVRNPALSRDLDAAADVASEHANWRFEIDAIAATMPLENPAKKELLTLLGADEVSPVRRLATFYIYYKNDSGGGAAFNGPFETIKQARDALTFEPTEKWYRDRHARIVQVTDAPR